MAPSSSTDKYRRDRSPDRREGRAGRSRSPSRRDRVERTTRDDRGRERRSRSRSPPRRRSSRSRSDSQARSPRRLRDRDRSPRSRSRSNDRHNTKKRRSRSVSSSSDDDRDEDRHRKRRKDKHHRRSRSRSRDRKDKKKDKKDRKDKKDKKKKKKGAVTGQWGLHGIIGETDIYNKEAEFRTWLVEERKINPETMSKDLNKKEFARFMEDYNTATLPHEKYYDMSKYEHRMSLMRNGETLPPPDDGYDPNADMAAISSAHKRVSGPRESYLSKEELMELRRVQNERIQIGKMKLLGMDIKQSTGVRMDGNMFED
ncbi:hypothetical protein BD410DRAFT_755452 [Rickenella mellea]|uniref:Uncharacterized protein n=1 Tax=Rickenella mellea TaxID=50990 RepID=A0A4Y7PPM3_9AGAM|nr:hypothetical protein BD410DRAFT_755452 [Rickenella mellea]